MRGLSGIFPTGEFPGSAWEELSFDPKNTYFAKIRLEGGVSGTFDFSTFDWGIQKTLFVRAA